MFGVLYKVEKNWAIHTGGRYLPKKGTGDYPVNWLFFVHCRGYDRCHVTQHLVDTKYSSRKRRGKKRMKQDIF